MGTDHLRGLALAYVHDITPEPLQILQKWDTSGHRRIALAFSSLLFLVSLKKKVLTQENVVFQTDKSG